MRTEALQLEKWRWLTGQKRGREKWLALLLLPLPQMCPYPLPLLCPSSCDLKTLLLLTSPHRNACWWGKRTGRHSCHEGYGVRKMIMQRSKWLERKLSKKKDRQRNLFWENMEGKYFKITQCMWYIEKLNNRRKVTVRASYLPITFISRTVLTVAVSHPLLTLEVYGTARIRVLCEKDKYTTATCDSPCNL